MQNTLEGFTIPTHVAIIMDGNGRWAKERSLPRIEGHRAGAQAVRRTLEACSEFGIRYLTLYAFSTENWKRSVTEVTGLMNLLKNFLEEHINDLHKNKIKLNAIGQIDRLPGPSRKALKKAIEETSQYSDHELILALSYGGRDELVHAAKQIAKRVSDGNLKPKKITEQTIAENLFTAGIPDPELIIRTSGEMRLSNFLIWQASYSEFYITNRYWPDFDRDEFLSAIRSFNKRDRRYGGVKNA